MCSTFVFRQRTEQPKTEFILETTVINLDCNQVTHCEGIRFFILLKKSDSQNSNEYGIFGF